MDDSTQTNTRTAKSRWGVSLLSGVASGVLTLIDPAKLRPTTRASLSIGTGAACGAIVWVGTRNAPAPGTKFRAGLALGLGAVGTASTHYGFVIDGKIHQYLSARGIANPRPLMAIGAALVTAATTLVEISEEHDHPESSNDSFQRELSPAIRELVTGILGMSEEFGARQLRKQLEIAREEYWGDPDEFTPELTFALPTATERTVPREFTFPVHAHYTNEHGVSVRASLIISDGLLDSLILGVDDSSLEQGSEFEAWASLTRWPASEEVTYVPEN